MAGKTRRQRGLALVMVLWASVLLAVLVAAILKTSRTDLDLSRNLIDSTHAELAADGALWTALHQVLTESEISWRTDGSIYGWRVDGAEIRVRITDEAGRIDINAAPPELLASLFEAAGESPDRAGSLAGAVVSFRDLQPGGFRLPEDLALVPDMPAPLVARVSDAITVYSGQTSPDASLAHGLALAAITGQLAADPEPAPDAPPASTGGTPEILVADEERLPASSGLLRIQAESLTSGGSHFARDALVELPRRTDQAYVIHEWRRGTRTLFPFSPG